MAVLERQWGSLDPVPVNLLGLPREAGLAPGEQRVQRSLGQDGPAGQSCVGDWLGWSQGLCAQHHQLRWEIRRSWNWWQVLQARCPEVICDFLGLRRGPLWVFDLPEHRAKVLLSRALARLCRTYHGLCLRKPAAPHTE